MGENLHLCVSLIDISLIMSEIDRSLQMPPPSTVTEVICCSSLHTQIELPNTCETYCAEIGVAVNDHTF